MVKIGVRSHTMIVSLVWPRKFGLKNENAYIHEQKHSTCPFVNCSNSNFDREKKHTPAIESVLRSVCQTPKP